MMEERRLSKLEASLGLALLAGLLAGLVGAYVYRFDQPPATPPAPPWISKEPAAAAKLPVEQTSYRPEWIPPHADPPAQSLMR